MTWAESKPGDVLGNNACGYVRIVARRVRPKHKARRLAEQRGGEVWIDGRHTWAVVVRED